MAPGRKQGASCWTCRLRRKRCDFVRPVCGSCQSLQIPCHSGRAKPSWMDGGDRQKHMSESIKRTVKQNAALRREKCLLASENQSTIMAAGPVWTSPTVDAAGVKSYTARHIRDLGREHVASTDSTASTYSTDSIRPSIFESPSASPFTPNSSTSTLATPISVQLGSVMIYLDHVFPFLFPFYQPSLIETGRQWLLGLICQNEVSFHLAASMSAYFFSLVQQGDEQDVHDDCKALVRTQLLEQMDMAVKSIQTTVSHHTVQRPLLDRIRMMEEITQLLIVEVTVQRTVDWTIHLTPALVLFDEVFKTHGTDGLKPSLTLLLNALPSSMPASTPHNKPLPYTADQSALVFFTSLLLYIDIIASTALGKRPVLQRYHHDLLIFKSEGKHAIRMETVVGCQNWALVAIADISDLRLWKREAKEFGSSSKKYPNFRAKLISQSLDKGLVRLRVDAYIAGSEPERSTTTRWKGYYTRHDKSMDDTTSIANITRVWAFAARIYLSVTMSGWQTKTTEIQANVTRILTLLSDIESPAQLRSLSWPVCIAGCLATSSQEHEFRGVIQRMGEVDEFGTMLSALHIMERIWSARDTIDMDDWDVASSLGVLGSPALLL